MEDRRHWSRREFIYGFGVAATTTTLAACSSNDSNAGSGSKKSGKSDSEKSGKKRNEKGSLTEPLAAPKELSESPKVAAQVKAGKLPPVDHRLPAHPYVIPHRWTVPGKYGGRLLMLVDQSDSTSLYEYMYGNSILRYLNDGQDIGPGLAESWDSNDDATVWTFHFRKNLNWSDGHSWSTADIMYWWQDLVNDPDHPATVPEDVRSGRDSVAKVTAPDSLTLKLTFNEAAPATAERLAANVNGCGGNGPWWMAPKHYSKQFHPKYNKKIKDKNWAVKHDQKSDFMQTPGCPTMTGWMCRSYKEGSSVVLERNPYYYCVDKKGQQIPYLDALQFDVVQDPEVQKLRMTHGNVDYVHGRFNQLTVADVSTLKKAQSKSKLRVWFWDSGSGTGSMTFFNYDYPDKGYRDLFRNPKFQRAMSYAYNRKEAPKAIYYNTGEVTTGTLSPKGVSFNINDEAHKVYVKWRDSYVQYDPDKAKKLLDGIGVVDKDGDGKREKPDGSRLKILLEYPADTSDENIKKCNFLKRDWEAVGISTQMNPISPDAFGDRWGRGQGMTRADWEIGDCSPMIYAGWVVPVQNAHWAPLHGEAWTLQISDPKTLKEQKDLSPWKRNPPWVMPDEGSPIDRLWKLYNKARVEPDQMKRIHLFWQIYKIHVDDGPFMTGMVANYPAPVLVGEDLRNVPKGDNLALGGWTNPWFIPSPAVYDPETYYWKNPEAHS